MGRIERSSGDCNANSSAVLAKAIRLSRAIVSVDSQERCCEVAMFSGSLIISSCEQFCAADPAEDVGYVVKTVRSRFFWSGSKFDQNGRVETGDGFAC